MVDFAANDDPRDLRVDADAADALRRIARDEAIKHVVQHDTRIHDALVGAALRYIGGEHLDDCCAVASMVNERGHAVSIDSMGESARDEATVRSAAAEFGRVVAAIHDRSIAGSISFDLTHLGLAIDTDLAFTLASDLAEQAERVGLEVMISAEGSERTAAVLGLYERLAERHPHVGITLQAYLHRTGDDLQRVLRYPGKVRITKGAFHEPGEVALPRGDALNARFQTFVEAIVARERPVSIATQDPAVLDRLLPGIPPHTPGVEIEMMHGVQPHRLDLVRDLGYVTRVYLPYGTEWFLYLCHRLAEHPPNILRAIDDAVGWAYRASPVLPLQGHDGTTGGTER